MSEAVLIQEGLQDLVPMENRSPGLHVSSIIQHMCVALGHFEADFEFGDGSVLEMGNAFEDAVIAALAARWKKHDPDRFTYLGELELDEIYGTPDLFDITDWAMTEIKLTWMSARHPITSPKFWRYWVQLMAYCRMAEVQLARLHVCHLNGDYGKTTRGPVYRVWERYFEREELEKNWRMLLTNGESLR